jgi:ABC-type proline/glycine betaine transport system substrate-binding protein
VEFVRSVRSKVFAGALLLALGSVLVGCGGSNQGSRKLGDIGWDENVVIANPTKFPLEDELGYENAELRTLDVVSLYQGVGNGELDAFQVPEDVLPAYGLEQKLVEASTPGMLAEVENRYDSGEDFIFIA